MALGPCSADPWDHTRLFGACWKPSQSMWSLMLLAELRVTKEAGGCAQTSCVGLRSLRTGPNLLGSLCHDVQGHGVQRPPREPQPCTAPSRSRPEPSHQELPWMPSAQPRASLHIFWDHKSGGFKQGNSPLSPEAGSQKSGVGQQQPPPCPQGWSPPASPSPWGPGAPKRSSFWVSASLSHGFALVSVFSGQGPLDLGPP